MRDAGVAPSKALGQHFLTDYAYVNRIVEAAGLDDASTVVEIGPGLGVLTQKLAEVAGRVIAVEMDDEMAARLREVSPPNVTVVHGDALEIDIDAVLTEAGLAAGASYALVGNLPYNVGTAIVRRFLETSRPPQRLIVMLQKEVAEGMTAPSGDLGLLGVSVQVYAAARKLFNVPPRAFYPPPRVTSAVIRLEPYDAPRIAGPEREGFFRVVRAGFSAPRKQVRNTLVQGLGLPADQVVLALAAAGIEPSLRPQNLGVDDWLRLARSLGAIA